MSETYPEPERYSISARRNARRWCCTWLALLLCAAAAGVLIRSLYGFQRQQAIGRRLRDVGGVVTLGPSPFGRAPLASVEFFMPVIDVRLPRGAIAKHDMKLLSECTSLTGLGLAGTDVCDDDLWTIDDLRLLETLDLSDTRTGDESLKRIANHSATLYFARTSNWCFGRGIKRVKKLARALGA